jgi:hypothetical protein
VVRKDEEMEVLILMLGIFITIFWMSVAWRAMKALEKIGDTLEGYLHSGSEQQEMTGDDGT